QDGGKPAHGFQGRTHMTLERFLVAILEVLGDGVSPALARFFPQPGQVGQAAVQVGGMRVETHEAGFSVVCGAVAVGASLGDPSTDAVASVATSAGGVSANAGGRSRGAGA